MRLLRPIVIRSVAPVLLIAAQRCHAFLTTTALRQPSTKPSSWMRQHILDNPDRRSRLNTCYQCGPLCATTKQQRQEQLSSKRADTKGLSTITFASPNDDDDVEAFSDEPLWFGLPRDSVANPLALLLASQFLLFIGVGAVIPSIPLYGKEIGLSAASNGIVISAPAVALLLLANFSGKFADQARKPAMMGGMALIVVSDLGTAMAQSLPALLVARLGLGAGRGISEAGERGLLADLAGRVPSLRGRALAAQQAVAALGIAIGAPLGGVLVEKYGPRASFLCVSAAACLSLISYIFLPETTIQSSKSSQEGNLVAKLISTEQRQQVDWSELIQDNAWKGLALCQCGTSFGFAAKIASIPILATNALPGGAIGAGALLSAAGLSGLAGAPIGGWMTDRTSSKSVAVLSGVTSALALAFIPVALSSQWLKLSQVGTLDGSAAAFTALVLLWSTSVAAQGPAMTALAQELAPKGSEATAMALPRAAGDGTYIVAPFLMGLVADAATDAVPGAECALAGSVALLGAFALAILGSHITTERKKI